MPSLIAPITSSLSSGLQRLQSTARQQLKPMLPPASSTTVPTASGGSNAVPGEHRHGSTHANLLRRPGARPTTQPRAEEPATSAAEEHADARADGATIVQPGNPTALLMDIQKIQSVMGMVQGAEQGLASMTTSASRSAVDAVQDIAA